MMMSEENAFLHQEMARQNEIIDVLLKENAWLKQVINTYLLGNTGINEAEISMLKLMLGNNQTDVSNLHLHSGNNVINTSTVRLNNGNNEMNISTVHLNSGNNETSNSNLKPETGINEQQYVFLLNNVRALMKNASKTALHSTAKMLLQLAVNPATPRKVLQQLTGLSDDGMAKRIMAMKKAGLITRISAPKRYLLTEKAKTLMKM